MSRASVPATLLAVATLVICACLGEPRTSELVTHDSSGVTIASNRGPDVQLNWHFRQVAVLNSDSEPLQSLASLERRHFGVDSAGAVAILDPKGRQVFLLDSTLRSIRRVGVPGAGPGELQMPLRLAMGVDGQILVEDFAKFALVSLGGQGGGASERGLQQFGRLKGDLGILGPRLLLVRVDSTEAAQSTRYGLYAVGVGDTTLVAHKDLPSTMVSFPRCGVTMPMAPLFAGGLLWSTNGDRLVVNREDESVIDVYDDRRLALSIRRELGPQELTAALVEAQDVQELRFGAPSGGTCVVTPSEVVAGRGTARTLPVLSAIMVRPDGSIWATRSRLKGEPQLVDVYSSAGAYRGTLSDLGFVPLGFYRNRVVGRVDGAEGQFALGVYVIENQ